MIRHGGPNERWRNDIRADSQPVFIDKAAARESDRTGLSDEMLGALNRMRDIPQRCDVTLVAGARHFSAHRIVLAARSAYLRDRLSAAATAAATLTSTLRPRQRHLTVMLPPHIDPTALHTLLDHMYSGRPAPLRNATVRAIAVGAELLQLADVQLQCAHFAAAQQRRSLAIAGGGGGGNRPPSPPAHLLIFDVYAQRMHLYDADQLWLPCTWTGGTGDGVAALPMPRSPFFGAVAVHGRRAHLFGDGGCTVWDAAAGHWTTATVSSAQVASSHRATSPPTAAAAALTAATHRRSRCFGFAVAVLRRSLCLLGGRHDGEAVGNAAERYDPVDGRWLPMRAMLEARSRLGAAAIGGWLFAVGGEAADGRTLRSVERYDMATDRWQRCAAMQQPRCGAAVATLGGRLYAAGGMAVPDVDGDAEPVWLRSVEVFEPEPAMDGGGCWRRVRDMAEARCDAGVVVWAGRLWVVGGNVGAEALSTVEVYDPVRDDWWVVTTAMEVVVRRPLVCVVETGEVTERWRMK